MSIRRNKIKGVYHIEILNTYTKMNELLVFLPIVGLAFVGFLILCLIGNLILKDWMACLKSIGYIIIAFILTCGGIALCAVTETKFHEVVITDYNKVDFDKFEIIEKKGKITVLKELK